MGKAMSNEVTALPSRIPALGGKPTADGRGKTRSIANNDGHKRETCE